MNDVGSGDLGGLNFDLPEEIRMLKDTVRRFVDKEMIPIERQARDPSKGHKLRPDVRAALETKAKALGLNGYDVPVEYGGQGLGVIAKVMVWAELARSILLPTRGADVFGPVVSPILYHLNDEQKKKYLLPTIRGELKWCLAQTEPDAGGDPGSMRTTAVREGDHYVVNGMKRFITGADEANFMQLIAATDRAKGSHGGISAFIVEADAPGFEVGRIEPKMGIKGSTTGEVFFTDCRVPAANRIGEEGGGFKVAMRVLDRSRPGIAAQALGIAQGATDYALEYAKSRETMGKPIAQHQLIQAKLADMETETEAARGLLYRFGQMCDAGIDGPELTKASAQAKLKCGDVAMWVATEAVQILGGYGYIKEYPVERFMRDAKITQIYEGTQEVQRLVIAREMLRESRAFLLAGVG